jgi:hypothetical protein
MAKISHDEIAYLGKPIKELTREELLDALTELSGMFLKCKKNIITVVNH